MVRTDEEICPRSVTLNALKDVQISQSLAPQYCPAPLTVGQSKLICVLQQVLSLKDIVYCCHEWCKSSRQVACSDRWNNRYMYQILDAWSLIAIIRCPVVILVIGTGWRARHQHLMPPAACLREWLLPAGFRFCAHTKLDEARPHRSKYCVPSTPVACRSPQPSRTGRKGHPGIQIRLYGLAEGGYTHQATQQG